MKKFVLLCALLGGCIEAEDMRDLGERCVEFCAPSACFSYGYYFGQGKYFECRGPESEEQR